MNARYGAVRPRQPAAAWPVPKLHVVWADLFYMHASRQAVFVAGGVLIYILRRSMQHEGSDVLVVISEGIAPSQTGVRYHPGNGKCFETETYLCAFWRIGVYKSRIKKIGKAVGLSLKNKFQNPHNQSLPTTLLATSLIIVITEHCVLRFVFVRFILLCFTLCCIGLIMKWK